MMTKEIFANESRIFLTFDKLGRRRHRWNGRWIKSSKYFEFEKIVSVNTNGCMLW